MFKIQDSKLKSNGQVFLLIVATMLLFAGCAPRIREPIQVCPGAESVVDSLSLLNSRLENVVSLKAHGWCLLQYYAEAKSHKENFPVKLWVNPPAEIYLQGDVAFDAKGIVLGSNEREFWLAIKPKEISTYMWGRWSDGVGSGNLKINSKLLLEALGAIEVGVEGDWSLLNEGSFDILTKRDGQGTIAKKIYLSNCDYLVRRIEYFDAGRPLVVTELDEYEQVTGDFFAPAIIKIAKRAEDDREDLVNIALSLKSVKPANFTEKQRSLIFVRPRPQGFRHIYKVVDGNMIEQLQ